MTVLDFTHDQLPGRIVFGAGRRHDAPAELEALGATSVLVLGGAHDASAIADLGDRLTIPSDTIVGVRPHVPAGTVLGALEIVDRLNPNVVVTVGGGSATGLGKMIALERDVALVAIPTTYAGSEMTPIWGSTTNGVKRTGRSLRVLPATVIYDPELTVGLPKAVSVNGAFNTLAHCVEALWLPHTSPMTLEVASVTIAALTAGIDDVVAQPDDVDARARLLYAAHRAGSVLATAGTGLLHQTAHVLGGMFDLDHGSMYAVLTPHMVGLHMSVSESSQLNLTRAFGLDPRRTLDDLATRLGAPATLEEIGFPAERTGVAAEAVAQHSGFGIDEIESLLGAAASGRPIPTRDSDVE